MAGDGLRSHRETITNRNAVKVRRLQNSMIVGTSGDVAFGHSVIDWLESGGDPPKLDCDAGFSALILHPTGEVSLMGQDCKPVLIELPYAVGSGMDLAIGAMRAGASPEKAVRIASEYDPHTGGKITVMERTTALAKAA